MHLVSGGGERPVWTFTDRLRNFPLQSVSDI
jgi:hypothetical protein